MSIKIIPLHWGDAEITDIQKVLESVINIMDTYFESPINNNITVIHDQTNGPMVLYARGKQGEYQVLLSSKDRFWAQYTYQFSHEYCHIRTNYIGGNAKTKWFEETICELASVFTLRRMSEIWKTSPPYENWSDYSSKLYNYADELIKSEDRNLPEGVEFSEWFKENVGDLENDRYMRKVNATIANKLLPIFEVNTKLWLAVTYLNTWVITDTDDIYQLFDNWLHSVPNELKPMVNILASEFGVKEWNNHDN
ncbi:hypothetical protein [Enterobacter asburiae]|uniref:hypothetical protein n=1 Tax=Enterobacter asburiae TaxID=61645 RepID=UPI002665A499|nr:hypothetical protein [Enterobacter asburiae]MDO2453454.1 hypothetical protein [Enterobacter asburiae]